MVAQGTVDELLASDGTIRLEVSDPAAAKVVLAALPGAEVMSEDGGVLLVELVGLSRGAVVAALVGGGVEVLGLSNRRRLEDVFLELLGTSS